MKKYTEGEPCGRAAGRQPAGHAQDAVKAAEVDEPGAGYGRDHGEMHGNVGG